MMEKVLAGLNDKQCEAVMAKDGPIQICSVAGSGKTTVLKNRTIYLIREHGINPDNILLTTFSKKSADEIRERIVQARMLRPRELDALTIGTFHSIGRRILMTEYKAVRHPLAAAFDQLDENGKKKEILSGAPQKWMIEAIMKEVGIDPKAKGELSAPEIMGAISLAKNELMDVTKFAVEAVTEKEFQIAEIYKRYEERKNAEKIVDFDDMILKLYQMLKASPNILKKYQNKFKYIMVDEAQDNNLAQYELVKMLGAPHNNVFIVGDDDQSMYNFRGARPEEFVNFKTIYPDLQIINLEQNYRSTKNILDVANELIAHNTIRLKKELKTDKIAIENKEDVNYHIASDDDEEAQIIAAKVKELRKQGRRYKEQAVIFRTNGQTRALEDHFIRNGIPYVVYGGVSFYDRKEVKDVISYMKLALNPHDDAAFERVVNTPSRFLGAAFMRDLKLEAKRRRCSFYDAVKTVRMNPRTHSNAMGYYNLITQLVNYAKKNTGAEQLVSEVRQKTGYDDFMLKDVQGEEESRDVLENLVALQAAASKHASSSDFIKFIDILMKKKVAGADAVQVMTIHKSKGLEFKHVYVGGFSDGLLPHKFALESGDPNSIEEERRLAYVAITRAQEGLDVISPLGYNGKGLNQSMFVADAKLGEYDKSAPKQEEVTN
jgi:DNA helicase-2/ATP-dependent DNA helicase PcrA